MAAVDYFLKLDGIEGESQDAKHKGEVQLHAFNWGLHTVLSATGGGGQRAGRPSFEDFHFTSNVSKASPKLMLACASGTHIPNVVLTCRKAGEVQHEFLMIKLQDVLVSSYLDAGSDTANNDLPLDNASLNFRRITFTYIPQDATGKPGQPVTTGWDLAANKKL
jgi:type VI secretion system secreted protein Hcp